MQVVRLLLSRGADASIRSDEPIRSAAAAGDPETVRVLLEHGASIESLTSGALANLAKSGGGTLLLSHRPVFCRHPAIVQFAPDACNKMARLLVRLA